MAPKNSGPAEDFPADNFSQDLGNRSEDLQRQGCAVEPAPRVEIVEQPAEETRFRYSRESRTNGSILGVSSTEAHKTYPSIRVNSYLGLVRIRVSCVTKDNPYRPHPHKIVGRENCRNGVFLREEHIREQNQTLELKYIGIQCTKREQYASTLRERAQIEVDPFGNGFNTPISYKQSHYVRLAIEILIPDSAGGWTRYGVALSDVITDLPTKLKIFHLSHKYGSAYGGTEITLLTSRLPNIDQLIVRFQDPCSDWRADVRPQRVHHVVSLVALTPPYKPNTCCPVHVTIHLVRPPSGDPDIDKHMVGEPCTFVYTPGPDYDPISCIAPKRQRTEQKPLHPALLLVQDGASADLPPEPQPSTSTASTGFDELDRWCFKQIPTPQSSQVVRETQNLTKRTAQQSWIRPVSNGITCPQREQNYQGNQQIQSSSKTVVSQGSVKKNDLNQLLLAQNLAPQSFQNNLTTPRYSNSTSQTNNKRNHSQISNPSTSVSHISDPIQMGQPALITQSSQTDQYLNRPIYPGSSPNFQIPPHLKAPTQGLPHPLPHQLKQPPIASIFERIPPMPQNQMFFEIPPTDESNMAVGAGSSSVPQFPLVDLTELAVENLPLPLDPEHLRYFETIQHKISWVDILSSTSQEWWTSQRQVPMSEAEQAAIVNSIMATPQASHDIEILSLSDELEKTHVK